MFATSHVDVFFGGLVDHIMNHGVRKEDRTGTGTLSVFGGQVRFDLSECFPALSLKQTFYKSAFKEMDWFKKGDCNNIIELQQNGVKVWDEWATPEGDVGPIYGSQWSHWKAPSKSDGILRMEPREVDQMADLVNGLLVRPFSRRHIVTAWNVADLPSETMSPQENVKLGKMALAPCHVLFQCVVDPTSEGMPHKLNMHLLLRSTDVMLGLSFNIAQYAYLQHSYARSVGMTVGIFQISFGDLHIYSNHYEGANEVVDRYKSLIKGDTPMQYPKLTFTTDSVVNNSLRKITANDVTLIGYKPQGHIGFKVAV